MELAYFETIVFKIIGMYKLRMLCSQSYSSPYPFFSMVWFENWKNLYRIRRDVCTCSPHSLPYWITTMQLEPCTFWYVVSKRYRWPKMTSSLANDVIFGQWQDSAIFKLWNWQLLPKIKKIERIPNVPVFSYQ